MFVGAAQVDDVTLSVELDFMLEMPLEVLDRKEVLLLDKVIVLGESVVVVVLAARGDTLILEDTLEELIPLGEIVVVVVLADPIAMLVLGVTLGELVVTGDSVVVVVLLELKIAVELDERLEELGTEGESVVVVVLGDARDALSLADRLEELGAAEEIVMVVVLGFPTGRLVLLTEDTSTVDEELGVGTIGVVTDAAVVAADVVGVVVDAMLELIVELDGAIVKEELELIKELEVETLEIIGVIELIGMLANELVDKGEETAEVKLDEIFGDGGRGVAESETLSEKRLLVEMLMLDEKVLITVVGVSVEVVAGVALTEVLTNELVDRDGETAEVELVSLDEGTFSTVVDVAVEES